MRTVIFLCEHQHEGSFGFVLNKQFEQSLDELMEGFDGGCIFHPVKMRRVADERA